MSKYEPRRSRTPSPKPPRQRFNEEWGLRDISHRAALLTPVGAGVIALAGLAVGSELSGGGSPPVVASHHVLTGRPPAHVQQPVLSASLMPPVLAAKHVAVKRASTKAHVRVARRAARSALRSSTVWVASHSTIAVVPAVSHVRSAASAHVATHSVAHSSSPMVVASVPTSSPVVARHPSVPSHQQQPTRRRTASVPHSVSHDSGHHSRVRSAPTSSKSAAPVSHSATPVSHPVTAVTAQTSAAPQAAPAATPKPAAAAQPAATTQTAATTPTQSFSRANTVTPANGGDTPAPAAAATPAPRTFSQANTVTPATGGDSPAPTATAAPAPAPKPASKPVTKSGSGWTSTVVDKPTKASVGGAGLILSLISVGVGGGVAMNRRRRGLDWRTGR